MNDGNDLEVAYKVLLELETRFNQKPRSGNLGIHGPQIQALTGYVHVFKQHPHPLIINTAILKLADWFRSYNNTVKLYILKVFKEASHHLEKVMNVDETVRRILPILGSNDPIARSLTLRVLGCMSSIIAEKLDVQFGIIQRLELATYRIELQAAIWASDQICEKSSRFAAVIFPKIDKKLRDSFIPLSIKLTIVKIFRHMHEDIGMTREAQNTCLNLLNDPNADSELVIVTLRTLTLLISKGVIDRKEQIDRLLDYALNDTRDSVRYSALHDLSILQKTL